MVSILSLADYNDRQDAVEGIFQLIKTKKIEFYAPKTAARISLKVSEIDRRIEPADRDILACAIEDGADILVTLDKKLADNQRLEKEFNIKISHPMDLV